MVLAITPSPHEGTPEQNSHVSEYLGYYLGFTKPPGYAVMVTGRWGAGKTFLIKRLLEGWSGEQPAQKAGFGRWFGGGSRRRHVIVSLYGLRSPQEIDEAMVAALYPWTTDDGVRIVASVGKAVLKHAKLDLPQFKASDLVNRMSADVFVFDDLERCRMKVVETFGYINQLVERDGCKVVVLANEAELQGEDGYAKGKEKLVGKTLFVEPDFRAAFAAFLESIEDAATKAFFLQNREVVRLAHEQSSFGNLRLLQQTMWDFERVFRVIGEAHRGEARAMSHLLRLFFALSFELKGGTLNPDDMAERTKRALTDAASKAERPRPFAVAGAKYPGLYLYDTILSDEAAYDILVRGVVHVSQVERSLAESSWFVSMNEPAWRILWHASERADADVAAAARQMLIEFVERRYDDTGEMLHVFGQMLWLADLGESGWDRAQTFEQCRRYVDDLRQEERLEAPFRSPLEASRHASHAGLGFSQKETPEFRELWRYVEEQRESAALARYPRETERLMDLMTTDVSEFAAEIAHGRGGSAPLAYVPVFQSVDAATFAARLASLDPLTYREALLGLSARWDMGTLATQLADERPWATALLTALNAIAETADAFAADRIRGVARWTIGRRLTELAEAEREVEAARRRDAAADDKAEDA